MTARRRPRRCQVSRAGARARGKLSSRNVWRCAYGPVAPVRGGADEFRGRAGERSRLACRDRAAGHGTGRDPARRSPRRVGAGGKISRGIGDTARRARGRTAGAGSSGHSRRAPGGGTRRAVRRSRRGVNGGRRRGPVAPAGVEAAARHPRRGCGGDAGPARHVPEVAARPRDERSAQTIVQAVRVGVDTAYPAAPGAERRPGAPPSRPDAGDPAGSGRSRR